MLAVLSTCYVRRISSTKTFGRDLSTALPVDGALARYPLTAITGILQESIVCQWATRFISIVLRKIPPLARSFLLTGIHSSPRSAKKCQFTSTGLGQGFEVVNTSSSAHLGSQKVCRKYESPMIQ